MKRILAVLLAIVLASGLLIAGCGSPNGPGEPPDNNTNLAPDFELENLEGELVSLSGLRGKPVLINFWATWCGPCIEEMPLLQEIHDKWTDKGLVFLAINVGETITKAKGFMERLNLNFPVLLDSNSEVSINYGVQYLPTTFLIDRDGTLLKIKLGGFFNVAEIEKDYLALAFPELQD